MEEKIIKDRTMIALFQTTKTKREMRDSILLEIEKVIKATHNVILKS